MEETLRIKRVTLRTEGTTAYATFELSERLTDARTLEIGLEYRGNGELHQAAVRRTAGIVDSSSFQSMGGTLHQVSESFDVTGDTVTLTIGRSASSYRASEYEISGYLEVDGARVQNLVPAEIL